MSSGAPMVFVQVAFGDVDGVADRRQLAVRAGLAVAAPGDVVDLFLRLAVLVQPALDDLDAVEVAAVRILQRRDQEGRRLACRRLAQVAAHRHALGVAQRRPAGASAASSAVKSQPPKKRTIMRGPVVA